MLRLVSDDGVLWIIDEAYMDFWDQSIADAAVKRDNLIVLRTCSKAFGLAALRLGFAIGCEALTESLRKAKSPANVNALTCEMAAAVISDAEYIESAKKAIKKSAAALGAGIAGLQKEHANAFTACETVGNFVYIVPRNRESVKAIWTYLKSKGILVRNLGAALRVTAGTDGENRAFLRAFTQWLDLNSECLERKAEGI